MKKTLIAATAVALALSAASAFAADLPSRKEAPVYVPPPPIISWTGLYAGLNIGGGWSANTDYWGNSYSGVVGGGQLGYNYQMNSFLIGLETDFQGTSIRTNNNNGSGFGNYYGGGASLPWFGTVRGRVGYLFTQTLLLYGTGGFAYGDVNNPFWSNTRTGWTVGGGVEWLFLPNWSAKLEYLYTDLSSSGVSGWNGYNYGYHVHPEFNTVRVGVNYHFNWGAPAPVLAKY
jgi:outer membrane immunogenic protein